MPRQKRSPRRSRIATLARSASSSRQMRCNVRSSTISGARGISNPASRRGRRRGGGRAARGLAHLHGMHDRGQRKQAGGQGGAGFVGSQAAQHQQAHLGRRDVQHRRREQQHPQTSTVSGSRVAPAVRSPPSTLTSVRRPCGPAGTANAAARAPVTRRALLSSACKTGRRLIDGSPALARGVVNSAMAGASVLRSRFM